MAMRIQKLLISVHNYQDQWSQSKAIVKPYRGIPKGKVNTQRLSGTHYLLPCPTAWKLFLTPRSCFTLQHSVKKVLVNILILPSPVQISCGMEAGI